MSAVEASIDTARGRFGVRLQGPDPAPVVLCLHGFPDDASTFDRLGAALAGAGYRVVAAYLRGYHPSPLEGQMGLAGMAQDAAAIAAAVSPDRPVALVGHDYGAQIGYAVLAEHPYRFSSSVMLAGVHPAVIAANARRLPRQWWASRYIAFFQLGRIAERAVARDDFGYVERLRRRWSPGFAFEPAHAEHVRSTLRRSMPWPVAMYRAGGFDADREPISTPTLFVAGGRDGCSLPDLARGQEALFTGPYEQQVWPGVGHYPHLEEPDRAASAVLNWLRQHRA